ncbi:MAG TPA: HAD family hydrolase [Terracidiphilus sp.]|nr:HAD family hydrolase [Terracidiphilus sp.]
MSSSASASPVSVRCKGILFDMDGVLISSLGSVERSWTKWALMRGVDPEYACRIAHGVRAIETVAKLRPDLDSEAELKIIEDIEMEDNEGLTVLPGVLELLAALPPERWTVVTSATERLARVRMAAGGIPMPERLVTADQVTRGKPHPEPFLAGAALLGFAPGECVVFEDSSSGARAGRAAGCTVVATTFSHPIETLDAAHYLVNDLTGIRVETLPDSTGPDGTEMVLRFARLVR